MACVMVGSNTKGGSSGCFRPTVKVRYGEVTRAFVLSHRLLVPKTWFDKLRARSHKKLSFCLILSKLLKEQSVHGNGNGETGVPEKRCWRSSC